MDGLEFGEIGVELTVVGFCVCRPVGVKGLLYKAKIASFGGAGANKSTWLSFLVTWGDGVS